MRPLLATAALAALIAFAPATHAQSGAFMPYVGLYFDGEVPVAGVAARFAPPLALPVALALQPAVEVTLDHGTNIQVDVNAVAEFGGGGLVAPYLGGGLAVVIPDAGDTNVGGNIVGGASLNVGFVQPFVQGRYTFADNSYFAGMLGAILRF